MAWIEDYVSKTTEIIHVLSRKRLKPGSDSVLRKADFKNKKNVPPKFPSNE